MKFILKGEGNKHLIILVHGLNGSEKTWLGDSQRFVENLKKEELITNYFDMAVFAYGTRIFTINWLTKVINLVKGFFKNRPKEDIKGFNVGIESISRPLESSIRVLQQEYDTISFITHSMGGLVTKSALTWLSNEIRSKTHLFISLSVPHIGAELADLGSKLLGNNPQIIDLNLMGGFTTQLNERYSNLNPKPKIVYQSGNQDSVVPRPSAIPDNVRSELILNTTDTHFSVVLIKDRQSNILFKRIMKELDTVIQPYVAIDVGIPGGTTFTSFIRMMASRLKFSVDFIGFENEELNVLLREDNISASSIFDFLQRIRDLGIEKIPKYSVEQEKNKQVYFLTKIKVTK